MLPKKGLNFKDIRHKTHVSLAQCKLDVAKKRLNFKYARHKILVPLAMSTYLRKKSFKLKKNTNNSWADVGPRSA